MRPERCRWLNYEGEIAIVIGRPCRNVSPAEAGDYIAGYTIANDYGLHDFRDTDAGSMLRVKGSDTLCPVGPGLVEGWDFRGKRIRTLVNGSVSQDASTDEMQWDMNYLVADIARTITLVPGDLLLSGTPANSRPVEPGDVVTVEVEGLGRTRPTRIVSGPTPVRDDVGAQPIGVGRGALDGARRRLGVPRPAGAARPRCQALRERDRRPVSDRVLVEGVCGEPRPPDRRRAGRFAVDVRGPLPARLVVEAGRHRPWRRIDGRRRRDRRCATRSRSGQTLGPKGRAELLHRLADLIDAHNDEIAIVETVDMGMLHESMRQRLVARGAVNFRTYADLAASYEERQWSSKGTANTVVRMPAGPAVIITPWNAPFMLSTWKVAPALAAGNTVILKPAEWSPLSCSLLADLTVEAGLPARRVQPRPGHRRGSRAAARR